MIAKGICAVPGCWREIERYGRCELHAAEVRKTRRESTRRWRKRRAEVLARAAGRCERCGAVATDAHHVVPVVKGGDDSTLMALCEDCHAQAHRHG
jgi:5-methylcytosine-specific restriction endonuclease McrA